jgi:predicted membrane metal-binding protein
MSQIASRKKMLIAESELNRALLAQDLQIMTGEVHVITRKVRAFSSLASAGLVLLGAFRLFRRKPRKPKAENTSWLKTILKTAGVASTLWSAFQGSKAKR